MHWHSLPLLLALPALLGGLPLTQSQCSSPDGDADFDGWTSTDGDCDDTDAAIHPGATERCNDLDDDCDGTADESSPWYLDADGDGYGAATAVFACAAPTGHVSDAGDCDDARADVHPGQPELCDGIDNDCDDAADEDFTSFLFRDADGDGFGSSSLVRCTSATGYEPARGDCNDSDNKTHPGAQDATGDSVDRDCGGKDGPQPHVGLSSTSLSDMQTALTAALPGDVVWVGPGEFSVLDLRLSGKAITLSSTQLAAKTVLNALQRGRVMRLDAGEGPETLMDGFTFTGGFLKGGNGGALLILGGSPTIQNCTFRQNRVEGLPDDPARAGNGGALYAEDSDSRFHLLTFEYNQAVEYRFRDPSTDEGLRSGGWGGAMMVNGGSPSLAHIVFENNATLSQGEDFSPSDKGGALYLADTSSVLHHLAVLSNEAHTAGGVLVQGGTVTVADSHFTGNRGDVVEAYAIALEMHDGTFTIRNSSFSQNDAAGRGAAVGVTGASALLEDLAIEDNNSAGLGVNNGDYLLRRVRSTGNYGTGLGFYFATFRGEQLTIANNMDPVVGGVRSSTDCSATFVNSLITHNGGYNFYNDTSHPCPSTFVATSLYSPNGPNENLSNTGVQKTWLEEDPRYLFFSNDFDSSNDDFHLRPDSPLRDSGDPSTWDADGSRAELGSFGGSGGDITYYQDSDQDEIYDGWERRFGFDPAATSAGADPDADGLINEREFNAGTRPDLADSDGDGQADGVEVNQGGDPSDWYRRTPGSAGADAKGYADAHIPGDFETLQQAVNKVFSRGTLRIASGLAPQSLLIASKEVKLLPESDTFETVLTTSSGSVLTAWWAKVSAEDLTFSGGTGSYGGNISAYSSDLAFRRVTVKDGSAHEGGGLYLMGGSGSFQNVVFRDNNAGLHGGGLGIGLAAVVVSDSLFEGNIAGGSGGGIQAVSAESLTVRNCLFRANISGSDGGGLSYLFESATTDIPLLVQNARFEQNDAHWGSGITVDSASARLENIILQNNHSLYKAALRLHNVQDVVVDHAVITGNTSQDSNCGGIQHYGLRTSHLTLTNSIVAYNTGYNLWVAAETDFGLPTVAMTSSCLYNPGTEPQHNLSSLDASVFVGEPQLLSYDAAGLPQDIHLSKASPLVNAGAASGVDVDGSRADMGSFGGTLGASWDLDGDGLPAWFWPGTLADAPPGFSSASFDADDFGG